jgi:hypothetical protein
VLATENGKFFKTQLIHSSKIFVLGQHPSSTKFVEIMVDGSGGVYVVFCWESKIQRSKFQCGGSNSGHLTIAADAILVLDRCIF